MQANGLGRSIQVQGLLGLLLVAVFTWQNEALAALYGLAIGLGNVALLGLSFKWADNSAKTNPKAGIQILYMSAVVRFILLAVLFVLGLQLFELAPLPVVLTFVVMQIGQVFNLKGKRRLTD
ncbi:MAG: ATP synthase subunit I [Hydrogenovibrio sp.]